MVGFRRRIGEVARVMENGAAIPFLHFLCIGVVERAGERGRKRLNRIETLEAKAEYARLLQILEIRAILRLRLKGKFNCSSRAWYRGWLLSSL